MTVTEHHSFSRKHEATKILEKEMGDVVPHLVKVPCYTQLSLRLLSRTCHINPANIICSSNKQRDLRGMEG